MNNLSNLALLLVLDGSVQQLLKYPAYNICISIRESEQTVKVVLLEGSDEEI